MRKLQFISIAAIAAATGFVCADARATLTAFTNRAAFEAAAGGVGITETFSVPQSFVVGNNFYNGVNYRVTGTSAGGNNVGGGVLNGDEFTNTSIDYIFPSSVKGFGADYNGANTSSGLFFTINGETIALGASLPNPGTGFFGVVSSSPFTTVDVNGGASPNEIYSLDNLEYVAVPEPLSGAMMLAGGLLLHARGRR
jgi:hypothetical protein